MEEENFNPTKLEYYDHMLKLQSSATVVSCLEAGENLALILDSTIFHPQGGGQPADTGFITHPQFRFKVNDVRSRNKIVFHYGFFTESETGWLDLDVLNGVEVSLHVDEHRRKVNSRLHSAGHLLDVCMSKVGLGHLEPSKGYHFPDGPFVEYKGTVPQSVLESKREELELEANNLISSGLNVSVSVVPYDAACELCGGSLPDYIAKDSSPRVVKLGDNPGCPCGGTHVSNISEIGSLNVVLSTTSTVWKRFITMEDQSSL